MPQTYDNYISDDADGFDRHDYFIEAQCSFCNTWQICIECGDDFICEQCQIKAEESCATSNSEQSSTILSDNIDMAERNALTPIFWKSQRTSRK